MAACFYGHTCIFYIFQSFYIDSCRSQQRLSQCGSQFVIIGIQGFFCHIENFSYKRKSVAVYACGCHTDQYISVFQVFAGDHLFSVADTNGKSCQIVFLFRHQTRMFCCLATDQGCIGLYASFCHTAYDLCDLLRIVLTAGNVIQEE